MDKILVTSKIVGSLEKVFAEKEPVGCSNSTLALLGERVNFQLCYKSFEEKTKIRYKIEVVGDLKDYVTLYKVDYTPVTFTPTRSIDDYYLGGIGLYPDILRPFCEIDLVLRSNLWESVFVSVDIPKNAKVGASKLSFILKTDEDVVINTLQYEISVIDTCIEKTCIPLTNWMHFDSICDSHGVEMFSEKFFEVFEKYLNVYVDIGFNMLLIPIFTPALDTYEGGERQTCQLVDIEFDGTSYKFDFTRLKAFIKFIQDRGIRYFEFSHLFTQWGAKACPKIIAKVNGTEKRIFGWDTASDSKEYVSFLKQFLPKLVDLIKDLEIKDKSYIHLSDEPPEDAIDIYKKNKILVHELIGDIQTIDALSDFEYYKQGLVDCPVPIVQDIDPFLDNNVECFVYNCTAPRNKYYSNRFINMPSQRTRIMGIQLYLNNIKGYLHWGFNFYNSVRSYMKINPYTVTDGGGYFPSGDAFIVYPDYKNNQVIRSLRAEIIKESFQDYMLLVALEKIKGKEFVLNLIEEEGLERFKLYPRSASWHYDFISKIKSLIKNG